MVQKIQRVVVRDGSTPRDGFVVVAVCKVASKATVEVAKPDPELSRIRRQAVAKGKYQAVAEARECHWAGAKPDPELRRSKKDPETSARYPLANQLRCLYRFCRGSLLRVA